jgi:hypothetical protein
MNEFDFLGVQILLHGANVGFFQGKRINILLKKNLHYG